MSTLSTQDVIKLIRKEFERKLSNFCEKNNIQDDERKQDSDNKKREKKQRKIKKKMDLNIDFLQNSIGLRVVHNDSGIQYTIRSVNDKYSNITLETPDKRIFNVGYREFEEEYKLG